MMLAMIIIRMNENIPEMIMMMMEIRMKTFQKMMIMYEDEDV